MFALWGGMWYDESEVMNFVVICSDVMLERIAVGRRMFALWGGMWYDESEVMNLGRRMYHDCVCSWNGCGYD